MRELEEEALAHSTEHGFRIFPSMGAIHRGWPLSEAQGEDALAQMLEGLSTTRAIGIELRRPAFLALVAEVCGQIERPREGLSAVAEALAGGAHTGQRYWDEHRVPGAARQELHALIGLSAVRLEGERPRSRAGAEAAAPPARQETGDPTRRRIPPNFESSP